VNHQKSAGVRCNLVGAEKSLAQKLSETVRLKITLGVKLSGEKSREKGNRKRGKRKYDEREEAKRERGGGERRSKSVELRKSIIV